MEATFDPTAEGAEQESPPTTDELLGQLLQQQREQREEVAALRKELAASKTARPAPQQTTAVLSAEELHDRRMEEVNSHSHYCPGCGRLYDYPRECTGRAEAPHQPIEVVSTDELRGDDPTAHTGAPNT